MEEVKVVVKQEAQGNAIAETEAKIKQLRATAQVYEDKGIGPGAAQLRAEANALEKGLARDASARQRAEAAVTREMEKQVALAKAQEAGARAQTLRAGRAALAAGQSAAGALGVSIPGGGASGVLGGLGGIPGVAALTVALAALQELSHQIAKIDSSAAIAAQGSVQAARTAQIAGIGGVRGEGMAAGNFQTLRGELESLKAQRGTFVDKGVGDIFRKAFGMETSGGQAERENNERIAQTETALALAAKNAEQKFTKGTGGMEIAALEQMNAGHGREARLIQDKVAWLKEYNRILEAGGGKNFAQAAEGASAQTFAAQKERAGNFARLVNARTGAGDAARIAALAAAQMGGDPALLGKLDVLTDTVRVQHTEAMTAGTRKNFSRGS